MVEQWGHRPSDAAFAAAIGVPPSTFSRYLKKARDDGMKWPPI
jgi:hypothetical protein